MRPVGEGQDLPDEGYAWEVHDSDIGIVPEDFMFQLTKKEKEEVVTNCDHLNKLKYSPYLPYAFTEHGVVMLANALNSPVAVKASVQIVRAFVRLRKMLSSNASLARKVKALEKKYDEQFKVVFEAIYNLMETSKTKKRKIGFKRENDENNNGYGVGARQTTNQV